MNALPTPRTIRGTWCGIAATVNEYRFERNRNGLRIITSVDDGAKVATVRMMRGDGRFTNCVVIAERDVPTAKMDATVREFAAEAAVLLSVIAKRKAS